MFKGKRYKKLISNGEKENLPGPGGYDGFLFSNLQARNPRRKKIWQSQPSFIKLVRKKKGREKKTLKEDRKNI